MGANLDIGSDMFTARTSLRVQRNGLDDQGAPVESHTSLPVVAV